MEKEHESWLLHLLERVQHTTLPYTLVEDTQTSLSYGSHLSLLDDYLTMIEVCVIRGPSCSSKHDQEEEEEEDEKKKEEDWSLVSCNTYDRCDLSKSDFTFRRSLLHLHHFNIVSLMIPRDHHSFSHSQALIVRLFVED